MSYVDTPQSRCNFGLSRRDITPPVGIYHRAWGAASHDRATGVHRPLTATAMALQACDRADEQVIVAVDLCLLLAPEMTALRDTVCQRTGLRTEQLIVAFSHTHAAGLLGLNRLGLPGGELIPDYLHALTEQATEAVAEARRGLQPATITYGVGHCALAANRDYWDGATQQFVCGFNPHRPADDTVLVARMSDASGATRATVVNYACHPTTLAWQNTLLSPDFPGATREAIEAATAAPCVFLQGASGDLGPREGYVGDPETADRNGRQLGHAALAALEALPPPGTRFVFTGPVVSGATLGTWSHQPLDAATVQRHSVWKMRRLFVDLPYRDDLLTLEQTRRELRHWQAKEGSALHDGDAAKARDCRAMAERMTRWLARLPHLPPGPTFPLSVALWRMGDAVWLAVEAEHYNLLQSRLRERFAETPIVVITLANGARATYLPAADAYGKGIYQESIAVLAQGSLERLVEAIGAEIADLLADA
jgi:hypothetical protein